MLQLFALKLAISVWKASINLSKKLRPGTWVVLAALNAAISIVALDAYYAKPVSNREIPPIAHAELIPIALPGSREVFTAAKRLRIELITGSEIGEGLIDNAYSEEFFGVVTIDRNVPMWDPIHLRNDIEGFPWEFPDRPERQQPTVIQVPNSQAPGLLTYFEKRVALAVSVITAFLSIINLFLAFQALRTFKAERELKNLQIAHLRLQVEKLQQEIKDAKQGKEKSNGIILAS